ncbi:hypothetical protein LOTGIDRAFT_232514 [Lottia gigantea]|uniref:Sodium-dependent phosphate transport protein 2B n=1 Tax=Lottia gigantea TaxID=225164 RepID=V4ABT4_LOTGI|nr:hypothetical protein LOTGIDRAFT_232514 [Lottia gigantea]ESO94277.1 hypothetical protein LOTGIDRAFT_232514 [Lottia gigantea]
MTNGNMKIFLKIADFSQKEGVKKGRRILLTLGKLILVFVLLYFFICSLDFLSSAFRLVAGKTAGNVFADSELLMNPISGLMIGVLATVLLQSSSTSTSIIITMVSANIIDVQPAIPIIMGANIGTTVTNTIVSMAHSGDKEEFRRAFSGATVHDVFNWLTVLVLLPLEVTTGCLYQLTKKIVDNWNFETFKGGKKDLLKTITKPLTKLVVQIDKSVITDIAEGKADVENKTILKIWCKYDKVIINSTMTTELTNQSSVLNSTLPSFYKEPVEKCVSVFSYIGWSDTISGIVLLICSLLMLSGCLILIVKLLHSILREEIATICKKTINANFPGKFSFLTGYVAILVGAGMTILVQSSSVFTSALTPLVGVGCLELERMLPLTLGSNIGTTATGVLAALAAPAKRLDVSLQLALCHLFFNILGILLYYPIPFMRKLPLRGARFLGDTTAEYRWFAIFYLFMMFLVMPGVFFGVSMAGKIPLIIVICTVLTLGVTITIVNILQSKLPRVLPNFLKTWDFLPECLRSLAPIDRIIKKALSVCKCCPCASCKSEQPEEEVVEEMSSSPIVKNCGPRQRTISKSSQDGSTPYQMLKQVMPKLNPRKRNISCSSTGENGSDENLIAAMENGPEMASTELSFVDESSPELPLKSPK